MSRTLAPLLLTTIFFIAAAPGSAQFTDEELAQRGDLEEFLSSAEIVSSKQMSKSEGVTLPYKLTLTAGGREESGLWKNPKGRMGGYWEGWQYEIAAYLLDKHLGLDMVPPTVERWHNNSRGALQLWVEHWISGREKAEQKISVPGPKLPNWNRRTYLQRAFDNLIGNEDRHLGNILITEDWRVLLIDHSRSFRTGKRFTKKLLYGDDKPMKSLPRPFVEKVRALDAATLKEVTGEHLTDGEIEAVMARKALMLAAIDERIASAGEAVALYD